MPSTNTAKDPKALLDQFASLQDQNKKQQQTIAAQTKQLKALQTETFQAFGDQGQRWRAARDFNAQKGKGKDQKGKGKDSKGKGKDSKGFSDHSEKGGPWNKGGKSSQKGDCPRCHGHHPELEVCANQTASNDPSVRVGELVSSGIKCSYKHPGSTKDCQGSGHLDRHHRNAAGADPSAPKAWANPAKSKGDGKGKAKGEGKKGDRRL